MFVGHYGIAFVAKAIRPDLPLGGLFVATQAMDIVFSGLLLAGFERVRLVPGGVGPEGVDLVHVPYSHGLVAAVLLALTAALIVVVLRWNRRAGGRRDQRASAAVVAALVLSHYVLDALGNDALPLLGSTPRVGIGLPTLGSLVTENVLVLAGAALYGRSTVPVDAVGRRGVPALAVALIAFNGYVSMAPSPATVTLLAISNMGAFAGIAAAAWWLDRHREPADPMVREKDKLWTGTHAPRGGVWPGRQF